MRKLYITEFSPFLFKKVVKLKKVKYYIKNKKGEHLLGKIALIFFILPLLLFTVKVDSKGKLKIVRTNKNDLMYLAFIGFINILAYRLIELMNILMNRLT